MEGIKPNLFFASRRKIKSTRKLNGKHKNIKIKQHLQVTYLGCLLNETFSGEAMALKVLNKINGKLKFLYRQNKFLNQHYVECYAMLLSSDTLIRPALHDTLISKKN